MASRIRKGVTHSQWHKHEYHAYLLFLEQRQLKYSANDLKHQVHVRDLKPVQLPSQDKLDMPTAVTRYLQSF